MEALKMVKIQENNKQFSITIPKDIMALVKWKKGDDVTIVTDQYEKDIILKKRGK